MTGDRSVQATVHLGTDVSLTVSTAGSGMGTITSSPSGINCTTPCSTGGSALFAAGQQVTLTAVITAGEGYAFASWTDCDSTGTDMSGDPTCTVTMNTDRSVTAAVSTELPPVSGTSYMWSNIVGTLGTPSSGPDGVSITDGDLWVADTGVNQIYEYTSAGQSATPALTIGSGSDLSSPRQAAWDPYRALVDISDTDDKHVAQYSISGATAMFVQNLPGTFSSPEGVAIDPGSGTVAVADAGANQIDELTADGTVLRDITTYGPSSTAFNGPEGVAFDPAGNLWVADTQANKVEEFDLSGNLITSWAVPSDGTPNPVDPTGIAVDPRGDVFLVSHSSNEVLEYTSAGTFTASIASSGTGNGQVQGPLTVAVDETNGDLYVADEGNNRIQRWMLIQI
jgi:streptogramin lyase